MTAIEEKPEVDPEVKKLLDQGAPRNPALRVPQPTAAGVCEEYHRAQPHLGLKRFSVRALNAEQHVPQYLLAADQQAAEKVYVAHIIDQLKAVGFEKLKDDRGKDAWGRRADDGRTTWLLVRTDSLTD